MTKLKKISLWAIGCLIVLVIFLSVSILIANKLINQKPILEKIQSKVSRTVNSKVTFQRLDVSFFPQPHLVVHQCRFLIPETASGTVASLTVYPEILSLFLGKFRNLKIHVDTPDIDIRMGKKKGIKEKDLGDFSSKQLKEKVGSALSLVSSKTPGLSVLVENGQLNITKEKKGGFGFRNVQARMDIPTDKMSLTIQCNSNLSKNISLKGNIYHSEDIISLVLEELKLDYPRLNLSGKLDIRHSSQSASRVANLELKALDVDVHSTRKVALSKAGELPIVKDIFDIVKGGNLPFVTLTSRANSVKDLGALENITINGAILDGEILVPKVDLDLKEVKGDVTISGGILQGHDLEARLGNTRASQGSLKLGLSGENAPFHLDMAIEADLAQLPSILKRVVDDDNFLKELALVEDLKGNASGRLVLGERLESITTNIDVTDVNLSTNYRRLPHTLSVSGGQLSYTKDRIAISNLKGRMGKSSFSEISLQLGMDKPSSLKVTSAKTSILTEEIFIWLSSFDALKEKIKPLKAVKGVFFLSALSLRGPLSAPEKWHFQATGDVKNLTIDSTRFEGTLKVPRGHFNITEKTIAISDLKTNLMDASLQTSGTITGYLKGIQNLDLTFDGKMGASATTLMSEVLNLPPLLDLKPPIGISAAHLTWNHHKGTALSGDLTLQQVLNISADIFIMPGQLDIKKLIIQDPVSHASIILSLKEQTIDLSFKGNLYKSTIDRLISKNNILEDRIEGDFYVHVVLDRPENSTARGNLNVKNLIVPWKMETPLVVNNLSLKTKEKNLRIESANLSWADNRFDLEGEVDVTPKNFLIDMKIFADEVNLDKLKEMMDKNKKENHDSTGKSEWDYPIQGTLNLNTQNLTYGGLVWQPFLADITLGNKTITVSVTDAKLCGIATPGILKISPQEISADFKPVARNLELQPSIYCLLDKSVKVDGNFELDGSITAQGSGDTLIQSLSGSFNFNATKGRFYSGRLHRTLMKIFNLINVTELFKGKLPDIRQEGFGYNSIQVKSDIKSGKVIQNEAVIDGTSMEIVSYGTIDLNNQQVDGVLLVAPLKAVDFFVKKIPLVKDILGGSLISIPIRITGELNNPSVIPLSPSAVGSRLMEAMKRTVNLPVQIVQPILPDKDKNVER